MQPEDMAFPGLEDFDRSYADATPEQRDNMLETAQWILQNAITDGPRLDTKIEEVLKNHELLFGELIAILSLTLSALRHGKKGTPCQTEETSTN